MTQLYTPVHDEDGNIIAYAPVERVPDEVIVEHPKYRKVVDEAYKRRQRVRELESQLESSDQDDVNVDATPQEQPETADPVNVSAETPPTPEPPAIDTDSLYEQFKQRLYEEQEQEREAKQNYQAMVNRVAKEYNVSPQILRGQNEDEITAHAKQIADAQLKFKDVGATPDSSLQIDDDLWKRIDGKLGLTRR